MNLIDKVIGFFSPASAVQRVLARQTLHLIDKQGERAYDAASFSRRTKNWFAPRTSATTENAQALQRLRDRARELVRNNCWVAKAINTLANNVAGSGMRASFVALKDNESERARAKALKMRWQDWANSIECDYDDNLNLYGLQNLIMRTVAEGGECLILKYVLGSKQKGFKMQLRLLEGDFIDTTKHETQVDNPTKDYDFYGIRLSPTGKRLGVWIYDKHPENGTFSSTLYTSDKLIHVFEKLRVGQQRGVPSGTSAFMRVRDMGEYEDAQLMRQKIAACFSLFVHNSSGTGLLSGGRNPEPQSSDLERVEPGMIQYLAPGEDIKFAVPPPTEGFSEYSRQVLRGIAGAYGITYEALTSDYSQVNFSSGKLSAIEQDKNTAKLQRDVLGVAMQKIYNWWAEVEALKLPDTERLVEVRVEWTTPKRDMIDPLKEVNAARAMLSGGIKSPQEIAREMGFDYDDTMQEFAEADKMRDKLGVRVDTDARYVLQKAAPMVDNSTSSGE